MASLDNARDQDHTYLKKQTASDGRLLKLAKNYAKAADVASAFDKLIGSGADDAIALSGSGHVTRS